MARLVEPDEGPLPMRQHGKQYTGDICERQELVKRQKACSFNNKLLFDNETTHTSHYNHPIHESGVHIA